MQIGRQKTPRFWSPSLCNFHFSFPNCQSLLLTTAIVFLFTAHNFAEPPTTAYVFPAGAQRGTAVTVRIGGHFLHDAADLHVHGFGITAPAQIVKGDTRWFEGPVIPQPASQQKEDYPVDYQAQFQVEPDASLGVWTWSVSTIQGVTPSRPFIVGRFPEVIEDEIDGQPLPQPVTLPATINGRIFPRQDIDIWAFDVAAGQTVTCAVLAQQMDSPLVARLEVRDPQDRVIAEDAGQTATDAKVRFTAAETGRYTVRIHDVGYEGLQHYVYRLTITAGPFIDSVFPLGGRPGEAVTLALQGVNLASTTATVTLPDHSSRIFWWHHPEAAANELGIPLEIAAGTSLREMDTGSSPQPIELPADGTVIVDGSISRPGEVDAYSTDLAQGQSLVVAVHASQLGSPLDSVVSIVDAAEKVLATADDVDGSIDAKLTWSAPQTGRYTIRVADRIRRRGGMNYAYRLHLAKGKQTSAEPFEISLPANAFNIARGGKATVKVTVKRSGYDGPIELTSENLLAGVTLTGNIIAKGQSQTNLVIQAAADAKAQTTVIELIGSATMDEHAVRVRATVPPMPGRPRETRAFLAVTEPTPFKFVGQFESKFAPRGSVFTRHYTLERNGFEGPIEISLADRQARHLQGVTGAKIVVPAGVNEFDFAIQLPPFLDIGRTSRTCLMAVGEVTLADGRQGKVAYTSQQQNDQIIVLTAPEQFQISTDISSAVAQRGAEVEIPITIHRGPMLNGPARVEIIAPRHIHGVSATPLMIAAGDTSGPFVVRLDERKLGPFNMPLSIRATTQDANGRPVIAECPFEFVTPRAP